MKVKLLKKVRKRFQIFRIDEIASNSTKLQRECVKDWGLPFYQIKDTEDIYSHYCRDSITAINKIREYIRKEYTEEFKHKPEKKVKVWHLKKK